MTYYIERVTTFTHYQAIAEILKNLQIYVYLQNNNDYLMLYAHFSRFVYYNEDTFD